jgi:hypothetical protein
MASWRRSLLALPAAAPRQGRGSGSAAVMLQLETANMPGDHINERSCAIRDVVAHDLRGASMETTGLFAHVLPQAVLARPRAGITVPQTPPPRYKVRQPAVRGSPAVRAQGRSASRPCRLRCYQPAMFCILSQKRVSSHPCVHRPHARRHASAGGGRAASAATVHHDGREDAIRDQRALYREGPHARQRRRRAPVAERARQVNGEYIAKARMRDHEHSR